MDWPLRRLQVNKAVGPGDLELYKITNEEFLQFLENSDALDWLDREKLTAFKAAFERVKNMDASRFPNMYKSLYVSFSFANRDRKKNRWREKARYCPAGAPSSRTRCYLSWTSPQPARFRSSAMGGATSVGMCSATRRSCGSLVARATMST